MFLDYWMIGIVILVAGIWSERRFVVGHHNGIRTTLAILAQDNFIKINDKGKLVPYPKEYTKGENGLLTHPEG